MATEHFTMSEMLRSDTAIRKRIWNGATREQEANLQALMSAVLEPLRKAYGKAIVVSSGFRNQQVNKLVGGASNSQHLKGEAADLDAGSKEENRKLALLVVELGLPFDQMIDEKNYAWIHVSYKRVGDNRGQILRTRRGGYTIIGKCDL